MRENGGGGKGKANGEGGGSDFFIHAIPLMLLILV